MRKILIVCFFFLSLFELAAENIQWKTASTISNTGVNASSPQVGINQSGSVGVAVWVEGGVIKASVYNGTSWGASSTISTGASNTQPQVVVDATGNATVVWINSSGAIAYVTRPAAGPFSGVGTIAGSANAISLRLAFDNFTSNANTIAIWGDNAGNATLGNIFASFYTFAMGTWSAVTEISAGTKTSQLPTVGYYDQIASVAWNEILNEAWVTNASGTTVSVINTTTNAIVATITVGNTPAQVAFSPDGKTAYVTNYTDSTVSVVNATTNTVTTTITGFNNPQGIAVTPNGKYAYVCNNGGTTVSVVDTSSNMIIGTINAVGNLPAAIVITPDGKFAYVCNNISNDVTVINLSTNTLMGSTIPVGNTPNGIAISPNGKLVYVSNNGANTVSVIDTSTNTVTHTITVGNNPDNASFTPNSNFAYVVNYSASNSCSVINTSTNAVIATVTVGANPDGVAVTLDGNYAYVANSVGNTISVIATATNTVVATISGLNAPWNVTMRPTYSSISSNTFNGTSWIGATTISTAGVNSANPYITMSTAQARGFIIFYTFTGSLISGGTGYTNVKFVATNQLSDFTWGTPASSETLGGIHSPYDLETRAAIDGNSNCLAMFTNSYDGATFNLEYIQTTVPHGGAAAPADVLQQNLYAESFSLGANSLGNVYLATMDYYINGGYTRIRSQEIDVTSYKPVWSYPAILSAKGTNNSSPYISVFPTPNGSVMNAAVCWLSNSGSNNVVQVTTGQETKVQPPTGLGVAYGSIIYGAFTDLTVTLTWTASTSTTAVAYNIYRDGFFVTQVPSTMLSYVDHNRDHGEAGMYQVATIDNEFSQSSSATVSYSVP